MGVLGLEAHNRHPLAKQGSLPATPKWQGTEKSGNAHTYIRGDTHTCAHPMTNKHLWSSLEWTLPLQDGDSSVQI